MQDAKIIKLENNKSQELSQTVDLLNAFNKELSQIQQLITNHYESEPIKNSQKDDSNSKSI